MATESDDSRRGSAAAGRLSGAAPPLPPPELRLPHDTPHAESSSPLGPPPTPEQRDTSTPASGPAPTVPAADERAQEPRLALLDQPRRPASGPVTRPTPAVRPADGPTLMERALDLAVRSRAALGVGLAMIITIGVLVTYQLSGPSDTTIAAEDPTTTEATTSTSTPETTRDPTTSETRRQAVDDNVGVVPPTSRPDDDATANDLAGPSTSQRPTTTSEASVTSVPTPTSNGPDTSAQPTSTAIDPSTSAPTSTTAGPGPTTSSTVGSPSTTATTDPGDPILLPVRTEAETGRLLGAARSRMDHTGYSGTGFVGDLIAEGSGVEVTVDVPAGGSSQFTIAYAAGPENGPPDLRTISVLVNGVEATEARMELTASWDDWTIVSGPLQLAAGPNVITLVWQPGDTGWVNLDYVEIS